MIDDGGRCVQVVDYDDDTCADVVLDQLTNPHGLCSLLARASEPFHNLYFIYVVLYQEDQGEK